MSDKDLDKRFILRNAKRREKSKQQKSKDTTPLEDKLSLEELLEHKEMQVAEQRKELASLDKTLRRLGSKVLHKKGIQMSIIKSGTLEGALIVRASEQVMSDNKISKRFSEKYTIKLLFHDESHHVLLIVNKKPLPDEESKIIDYIETQAGQEIRCARKLPVLWLDTEPPGEWLGDEAPRRKDIENRVVSLERFISKP